MTDRQDDDTLDAFFQAARANETGLPAPLAARIVADAERLRPGRRSGPADWLAGITSAIGGWRPLAGLTAAGVAGLWIGAFPPDAVAEMTAALLGDGVEVDFSELYALSDDDWIAGTEG